MQTVHPSKLLRSLHPQPSCPFSFNAQRSLHTLTSKSLFHQSSITLQSPCNRHALPSSPPYTLPRSCQLSIHQKTTYALPPIINLLINLLLRSLPPSLYCPPSNSLRSLQISHLPPLLQTELGSTVGGLVKTRLHVNIFSASNSSF